MTDVHAELNSIVSVSGNSGAKAEKVEQTKAGILSQLLDTISGIFSPIVPAIVGAGLLKGIIVMLTSFELVSTASETFQILSIFGDATFYFLPLLLGVSSAIKFKCNPYIAAALGGVLLHPQLATVVQDGAEYMSFFGIPMKVSLYVSSVLPIVLSVWFMSHVERTLDKVMSRSLKGIFQPVLTLIIVAPVMLAVLGPVGSVIGNFIATGFLYLYDSLGLFAGLILGVLWGPIVITGMHYGFLPVKIESLSKTGFDYVMAIGIAGNAGTAGATFAVYLMTKNKNFKSIAGGAAASATIGITEPALFGITTKLKRPLFAACLGGGLGGAVMGLFHVGATGIGTGPLAGMAFFFGPQFVYFVAGCVISFVTAMIFTKILGFEDVKS